MKAMAGHPPKKDPARFSIRFNPANPRHAKAIEMLDAAGRCKAALVAEALSKYLGTGAEADFLPIDVEQHAQRMEQRQVLASMPTQTQDCHEKGISTLQSQPAGNVPNPIDATASHPDENDLLRAISDGVDAFY